jgi:hypothetical protein
VSKLKYEVTTSCKTRHTNGLYIYIDELSEAKNTSLKMKANIRLKEKELNPW